MEEKEIFSGKTLPGLFSEIYENSKTTQSRVLALIGELKPLIESVGDATIVVPLIKDYMDIGLKNDDNLIKLAQIIQKMEALQARQGSADGFDITELQSLLEDASNLNDQSNG
jgi:hypothetical protein